MYIPLKVTTDYSMLKSLIKVNSLIDFLVKNNINACGICDDNLYGVMDFYKSCKQNNIKPLLGLEIKVNDNLIYLYAINYDGYKNLLKIHTIKEQREISIVDLKKYSKNILIIIPFKSKELFDNLAFFDEIYVSYSNLFEKNNSKLITSNTVYVENIKSLDVKDIKYLNYLDDLRKEERIDYSNNYYQLLDIVDDDEINEVVNKLNVKFPNGKNYIPKYSNEFDSKKFLNELTKKGLLKRLNGKIDEGYQKRLNHELDVINSMGFTDYFLIVYDYVLYAKKNNILSGCRGSAAGSLVSYSIGITDIDPIKYDLLFERFLNPARVTMPDIDMDFDATRREEVIEYVRSKYGNKKVALGLTFNTLKSKLVLREVGKILNVDSTLLDKFVKNIDAFKDLKSNLENPNIKKYLSTYKNLKEVYEVSMHLEGLKKNTSTHAAGVVICSEELDEVIPVHYEGDTLITGITMEHLEEIGLLKMDFLGLKNLTTIANITKKIGSDPLKNIDLNDRKVLDLFSSGKTEGIFQFETPMMKGLIQKLKPRSFSDLVAAVALGRPGPKEHAQDFIKRKEGLEKVSYIDPSLENILKETYGVLIYQEQIIAILGKVAGYTYGEADLIRRAISKKKEDVIKQEESKFITKAINNGYTEKKAQEIYDLIAKFASYGFNKSHSVAYAIVAFNMAYLKTYYPIEFLVELLNSGGEVDKNNTYLAYLKTKNIKLYKPSVNNESIDFLIEKNKLILPLKMIKNISLELSKKINEAKKDKYTDLFDFCYKTKEFMTEGILINLINAGAMDEFGNHQTLINNISSALNYASLQDDAGLIEKPMIVEFNEYDSDKLKNDELASFGFYITNHPSSKYMDKSILKLINFKESCFKKVKCVVVLEKINKIKTKNGDDMAFLTASDDTAAEDFTVFPNAYKTLENIKIGDVLEISGEVSKRFDKYSIIVNNIRKVG